MLIIFCALECEAKPIISRLRLKKTSLGGVFPVFSNDNTLLVITGTGLLRSAIATSSILTKFAGMSWFDSSLLLNLGVCGSDPAGEIGVAVLPHTISSGQHKKKYFQELFIKHSFREVSLLTVESPQNSSEGLSYDCVDMEAYGFFQAASLFLKTSQIYCIKIISDLCDGSRLEKDFVSSLIEKNLSAIFDFTEQSKNLISRPEVLTDSEKALLSNINKSLNLTSYQELKLNKSAISYKVRGCKNLEVLSPFLDITPKNKLQVKEVFAKIQEILNAQ